jgi:DNA transformation protein
MSQEFCDYLCEVFEPFAPVQGKRMFGGYGLFVDKLMFGLVADNSLYLKVDEASKTDFLKLDLQPFTYVKNNKPMQMSYYQAPEEIYEDNQLAGIWFNRAYAAALRSKKP